MSPASKPPSPTGSPSSPSPPRALHERDLDVTSFTKHLDALLEALPDAACAVFVDGEGETVDLSSRVDPFDARIAGAECAILLFTVRAGQQKLKKGETLEFRIEADKRSIVVRTVTEGYDLIVLLDAPEISARAAELVATAAIALLKETGLPAPPTARVLRAVEERQSLSGMTMPRAFEKNGVRHKVEAVLGHRNEGDQTRFLVRLDDGEELLLSHEPLSGRWSRA